MPRVAYTIAQKHEAVALAAVVGAEAAADQLGIDVRSVRKWAEAAGHRPELDVASDDLQALYTLAVAKVTADVVGGKIKGSALMTVVGIARDKLDRAARWREARAKAAAEPDAEPSSTPLYDAAEARWDAWVNSLEWKDHVLAQRWASESIQQELHRRAEARDAALQAGEPIPPDPDPYATPQEEDEGSAAIWDDFLESTQRLLASGELRRWADELAAIEAARREQRDKAGRWLDDEEADLLIEAEKYLEEIA